MAKHVVKCPICKKEFDTNSEQAVHYGARRYAHAACDPENTNFVPMEVQPVYTGKDAQELLTEDEIALRDLKDYIKKIFEEPNWGLCQKEIKEFNEKYGYTYSGILKTLVYFFEVKQNSPEKSKGHLGIVPYVYKDAYNYYYNLFLARDNIKDKEFAFESMEVIIPPPAKIGTKRRLLNLGVGNDEK